MLAVVGDYVYNFKLQIKAELVQKCCTFSMEGNLSP